MSEIKCKDCGMLYDDFGLDTTLPNNQWSDIKRGEDEMILCANCMVKRASKFGSVIAARMVFDCGVVDDNAKKEREDEV